MSDLKAYEELVNAKAEENSTEILPNAGEKHAAIVMAKMFEKATESVNMIVGSFDGSVSDQENYMANLKKCVEKGTPFKILFLENPNQNSLAFIYLKKMKAEGYSIVFKRADAEEKDRYNKSKKEVHFSVFDTQKFRFEKDVKKYLAWFCFNDTKTASQLNDIFNLSFDKLPELEIA